MVPMRAGYYSERRRQRTRATHALLVPYAALMRRDAPHIDRPITVTWRPPVIFDSVAKCATSIL
jgi:hypothetical protein